VRIDNLTIHIDEAAEGMRDFAVILESLNAAWRTRTRHDLQPRPKRRRRINGRLVPLRNRPGKSGRKRRRRYL